MLALVRLTAAVLALVLAPSSAALFGMPEQWIGTWEAAPASADDSNSFTDNTLREVVHASIGGGPVRVRFSNTFGVAPLTIAHATIAMESDGATAVAVPKDIAFGGGRQIVIPPHAQAFSDPIAMALPPGSNLLISIYVPGPTGPSTYHPLALQTSYYASGDHASDVAGTAFASQYAHWYFLSGIDVARSDARGAVVALGDSITDGANSKPNENGRWPDVLAGRLAALPKSRRLGVLNAGISGNRILLDGGMSGVDAIARFDRDVIGQSGAKDVIVLLGINDIQQLPHQYDPLQIEAGLRQIALQAHEHGLRIFGCTILPYGGFRTYSPAGEAAREAVNAFILSSGAFDGAFDFDRAIADPTDPHRMAPKYDGGDHLHPNTAGLHVMGSLIEISKL